jgi:cell division septum initiation protein DivIVA
MSEPMTEERFAEIDELLESDDVSDDIYDLIEAAMALRDEVRRLRPDLPEQGQREPS